MKYRVNIFVISNAICHLIKGKSHFILSLKSFTVDDFHHCDFCCQECSECHFLSLSFFYIRKLPKLNLGPNSISQHAYLCILWWDCFLLGLQILLCSEWSTLYAISFYLTYNCRHWVGKHFTSSRPAMRARRQLKVWREPVCIATQRDCQLLSI